MRNKPRLYLALYARLKYPNSYHYALHVTPKKESIDTHSLETTKYHCKNQLTLDQETGKLSSPWALEVAKINPSTDSRLLCRILLGKIQRRSGNLRAVEELFTHIPIFQDDETYNCVAWVRLALVQLDLNNLVRWAWPGGMEGPGWEFVQRTALNYVKSKKLQGRFEVRNGLELEEGRVATYDMILARETVP